MATTHLDTTELDDRVFWFEIATHELEGADHRHGPLDARKRFEGELSDGGTIADRTDDGTTPARRNVGIGADVAQPVRNMIHIGAAGVGAHHDDDRFVSRVCRHCHIRVALLSGWHHGLGPRRVRIERHGSPRIEAHTAVDPHHRHSHLQATPILGVSACNY